MPEIDPREPYQITMLESGTRVTGPGLEKWANEVHHKDTGTIGLASDYRRTVQIALPNGQTRTAHGAYPTRASGGGYYLNWDAVS